MILTPQESKVMDGRPFDAIITGLQRALATNMLVRLDNSDHIYAVTLVDESIPAFTLPIMVVDVMGRKRVCIDLRKNTREYKIDEVKGTFIPVLLTETNFLVNLAIAQSVWREGPAEFNNIYFDACRIYAMWLAMKTSKRLVLSAQQQNDLVISFSYYWLTRYNSEEYLNDNYYNFIVNKISTLYGFNQNEVLAVLDKFNKVVFTDIEVFCKAISHNAENPKMKSFNRILLQTMVLGSWLGGSNSRELTSVAVEYPPVFLTILYRALNERSFRNSDITQLAMKLLNKAKQDSYSLVFADILRRNM